MLTARTPASPTRRHRALLAALAGVVAACAAPAAARAEVKEVGCSNLRSTIESLSGEGETVVLDGLCTSAQLKGTGIVIPAGVGLTLRGAPGTTSGIDGTGISGSLLSAAQAGALTIEGLTFEHAATSGGERAAVFLRAARVTISGDAFLEDERQDTSAAGLFVFAGEPSASTCPGAGGPPVYVVRDTTFRGNVLTVPAGTGGGAAAALTDQCPGASHVIEGNVVEGNVVRADGSSEATGAGVQAVSEAPGGGVLSQSGNVFAGNRIEVLAGSGRYGGGGEWLLGMSTTSVGDRFSGNVIPGAAGTGNWSWGAGLGIRSCNGDTATQSTLEDAVVTGNSIVGGTPSEDGGAGIYVGCPGTAANHLALLDSTVTGNSAPVGGVAGVDGGPGDALSAGNSILAQDLGGRELGGFTGTGGSLTAAFSDVCAAGTASPLAGEGNICADPRLAGEGIPGSTDVEETFASPTREAGSDALVPAGLGTDYYGAPRVAGGRRQATCFEGVVQLAPAVVDIGAAEIVEPLILPLAVACPAKFVRSQFSFPTVSVRPSGVLLLTFHGLGKGTVVAQAHFRLTETVMLVTHGHRRRVRRTATVAYGQAARTGALPALLHLRIAPRGRPLRVLRGLHHLSVSLSVTYAADRLYPATQARTVRVRWIAPPRHRRHG